MKFIEERGWALKMTVVMQGTAKRDCGGLRLMERLKRLQSAEVALANAVCLNVALLLLFLVGLVTFKT